MISCPECDSAIDVEEGEVDEGDIVACDECGTEFEVVTSSPLELSRVSEEEEDEEEEEGEKEAEDDDHS